MTSRAPRPAVDVVDASAAEIRTVVGRAQDALAQVDHPDPRVRAALVEKIADEIEKDREAIIDCADSETALGLPRLSGELTRTVAQLHFYAAAVRHGDDLELAIVDGASDKSVPDLIRTSVGLGPVAVFGAGNFPLAFGALGTDCAAALAAGCPVVVKGHPSHPGTSGLVIAAAQRAIRSHGAPEGTLALVHGGNETGRALVLDEGVAAVAFTGSLSGGSALIQAAAGRQVPIPVFAEMGSVNPVVVTVRALAKRHDQIAQALAGSVTASAGQLCTKPGVIFVPTGDAGDALVEEMAALMAATGPLTLLDRRIAGRWQARNEQLVGDRNLRQVLAPTFGDTTTPALMQIELARGGEQVCGEQLSEEVFGPGAVVVRYRLIEEVRAVIRALGGQLTLTIHAEEADLQSVKPLLDAGVRLAGRLVWNGVPTGVSVVDSMHHGGPWPASSTSLGSVGTEALRRFRRPVTWQGFPADVLRDQIPSLADPEVTRRENGRWRYLSGREKR